MTSFPGCLCDCCGNEKCVYIAFQQCIDESEIQKIGNILKTEMICNNSVSNIYIIHIQPKIGVIFF